MPKYGKLNLDSEPDVYLPARRARRVVRPLYMAPHEIPRWHDNTLSRLPKVKFTPPLPPPPPEPVPVPVQEPVPVPVSPEARRRRPAPRYLVAWRNEWGECGEARTLSRPAAEGMARQYQRTRCWALAIDTRTWTRVLEVGTPFRNLPQVDLVARRNAPSQSVSTRRKPAAVAQGTRARRAA